MNTTTNSAPGFGKSMVLAALCLLGEGEGMPQDSATYFYTTKGVLEQLCYYNTYLTLPASGLTPAMVTEYELALYSDPLNGYINVDRFNRPGSYRPPDFPGRRDRGGDAFLEFFETSILVHTHVGCATQNGFSGLYNWHMHTSGAKWLKIAYARSGTSVSTVSQPFAIKKRIIPIGRFNWGLDASDAYRKTIPLGDFGLEIRRVAFFKTLVTADPGNQNLNPNTPTLRTSYDMNSSVAPYPGISSYFSEKENAFVVAVGTELSGDVNRAINRGYILTEYLAAQCSDGTAGFLGANVGSRTVASESNVSPFTVNAAYAGCHGSKNGIHVIENTGDDIWGTADKLRYAYKGPITGNKNLIAKVEQLENTASWARAGIMIRAGAAAGDRNVAVFVTPGNGLIFQARTATNGSTASVGTVASIKAPIWLRLEYINGTTRAYYGSNGTSWTQIANGSAGTYSNYQAGLAAASRSAYPNTSVYSGLSGF
jgi:hypothetical protein